MLYLYERLIKVGWKFWRRNTNDPLAKILFENYRLNMLTIPREKASVGDLYMRDGEASQLSTPGSITNFLEPTLELPPTTADEFMADEVSNVSSHNLSANLVIDFVEGFLTVLLGRAIAAKIRATFEEKKTQAIQIQFGSLSRDALDVFALGNKLKDHKLKKDSALYDSDRRYYVVCGVARAQSIIIVAQDDKNKEVGLNAQVINSLNLTGTGSIEQSAAKQITFKGAKKLAFGVELYELRYDTDEQRLKLDMPTGAFTVRGPPAAYVGKDESMFFELE